MRSKRAARNFATAARCILENQWPTVSVVYFQQPETDSFHYVLRNRGNPWVLVPQEQSYHAKFNYVRRRIGIIPLGPLFGGAGCAGAASEGIRRRSGSGSRGQSFRSVSVGRGRAGLPYSGKQCQRAVYSNLDRKSV